MSESGRLLTSRFLLMCLFTFTVFLSAFQLLPTAPFRILELHGDKFAAGLFLGFLTYASAFSAPLTGALADRIGRTRMLLVASLAITGFSAAYALSRSWKTLVILVFFHGIFWSGLLSASSAFMTGMIPASRRAEGIAYWGMATVFATAFAPALGLWLFRHGWTWVCASCGLLNLVMAGIAWALREPPGVRRPFDQPFFTHQLVEWHVFAVSLSLFLYTFGYGGITSFVALWTERNGIQPRGIYFMVFSLVVLVTRPFSGRLADQVGHLRVLFPCFAAIVGGFVLLIVATTPARMIASAALWGLGFGNAYPIFVAHVLKYVAAERRGAAFGGILAAFDTGIGTGSIVLGWVIQHVGFRAAWSVAAALSALSIPAFALLERRFLRRAAVAVAR
jgi:MFS family permease